MPSNPRQAIKQRLDSARTSADRIALTLVELGELYGEHHPEIKQQYEVVYALAVQLTELLDALLSAV